MRISVVLLVPLLGTASNASAEPPHAGTWAIDYTSSDRGEVVWGFDDLDSGIWQFSSEGRRILQFRMDDNECATCVASEPWKAIGPGTWDTGWLGPSGAHQIIKIAEDGGTLSINTEETGPNGESIDRIRTFERLSGGPGLAGTWRLETGSTSPPLIELTPDPYDVLVFKSPAEGLVCVVILGGADYPCFAAVLAPGRTMAMTMRETQVLAIVLKQNGEPFSESTYTVSSDGKSMIQTTKSVSGRNIRTVYHRQ